MVHERLIRLNELIPKLNTGQKPMIPISRSQWWLGVKQGIYPQPVKLGQRMTAWRLSDIEEFLKKGVQGKGRPGEDND